MHFAFEPEKVVRVKIERRTTKLTGSKIQHLSSLALTAHQPVLDGEDVATAQ